MRIRPPLTGNLPLSTTSPGRRRGSPAPPLCPSTSILPNFPSAGPAVALEPGVEFHEIVLRPRPGQPSGPGRKSKLWLYLPKGKHEDKLLPCILIAPAGSILLTGMKLENGDRAEHVPYVRAGFAVLAFELDGGVPPNASDAAYRTGYFQFRDADGGLVNARNAFQFLLTRVPEVDPNRIFAAGHSSAAAFAVFFAEHEPRLIGCAAFAPALDYKARFARNIMQMRLVFPEVDAFIERFSPRNNELSLSCPLYLFGAEDDANTPISGTREAFDRLEELEKVVTLDEVRTGNHYDSMIKQGIPQAIGWMKERLVEKHFPEPSPPDGALPIGAPVASAH